MEWGLGQGRLQDRCLCRHDGEIPRGPKGLNPDFTLKNIQRMPDSQVKTVLADLEKMIPQEVRKWVDWEQTKSDQGPFPRKIYGEFVVRTTTQD